MWPRASPYIAGVTGTKGKTTTTLLLSAMLAAAGYHVITAGNLRVSMLAQLPAIAPETRVVLELSSWQLEAFTWHHYSPPLAIVTNVLPDHLNRYPDLASYAAAKRAILAFQKPEDTVVLNRENPWTRAFAHEAPGQVRWFAAADTVPGQEEAPVQGEHQRANRAAAAAAAQVWGASAAAIAEAVRGFQGYLIARSSCASGAESASSTTPPPLLRLRRWRACGPCRGQKCSSSAGPTSRCRSLR